MRSHLGASMTMTQWDHLTFFVVGFILGYWGDVFLYWALDYWRRQ